LHLADGLREILASEGVDPGEWHVDQTAIAGQRVRYELVAELAATLHTADGLQDVLTIEGQRQALVQDLASSLHLGTGLAAILGSEALPLPAAANSAVAVLKALDAADGEDEPLGASIGTIAASPPHLRLTVCSAQPHRHLDQAIKDIGEVQTRLVDLPEPGTDPLATSARAGQIETRLSAIEVTLRAAAEHLAKAVREPGTTTLDMEGDGHEEGTVTRKFLSLKAILSMGFPNLAQPAMGSADAGEDEGEASANPEGVAGGTGKTFVVKFATGAGDEEDLQDELERVEGIGPRIATALRRACIHTYRQLAEADAHTLQAALTAFGLRFSPSLPTWSRQAATLAAGDEGGFLALTRELVSDPENGRRQGANAADLLPAIDEASEAACLPRTEEMSRGLHGLDPASPSTPVSPRLGEALRDLAQQIARLRSLVSDGQMSTSQEELTSAAQECRRIEEDLFALRNALTDFGGQDLRGVDLSRLRLDGIRWSNQTARSGSTHWPPAWQAFIERHSVEIGVGQFEVRDGVVLELASS
jgi:predicted flap endonuclease-1-like 5' DNA nuclease